MKIYLLPALLLCAISAFAQQKPDYYFDEEYHGITKEEFTRTVNTPGQLHMTHELDTFIMHFPVTRVQRGTLPASFLAVIRKDIEASANTIIDSTRILVVDYYHEEDPCNASGTRDTKWLKNKNTKYIKNLNAIAPVAQFNIYNKPEGLERYKGIKAWYPDTKHRLRNTFFPMTYPCGSFVVIHPDGRFISSFGEYSIEEVCKFVTELSTKK